MPKMFLIDIEGNKKQLLDEQAALKVIDNDFSKIKQITTLQENTMRYRVKLRNNKQFLVEASKMDAFLDKYFPIMEALEEDDFEDWEDEDETLFYPQVCLETTGEVIWPSENDEDQHEFSILSDEMMEWITEKADKISSKFKIDCYARVIDGEGLIAYTTSEDEEPDEKYVEYQDVDASDVDVDNLDAVDSKEDKLPKEESLGVRLRKDLNNEMSAIYQLYDEYEKVADTTDEVGNSMAKTTVKPAIDGKFEKWRDHVDSILECERQIKSGKVKPGTYDQNIKLHIGEIRKFKQWAENERRSLRMDIQNRKEEVATKTRRHEDLRQNQGLEWKKDARMAANGSQVSAGAFDALRQRLAKQNASQNPATPNSDQTR